MEAARTRPYPTKGYQQTMFCRVPLSSLSLSRFHGSCIRSVFQFLCAHQPDAAPRFYSILYSNDRKGHRRAATIMPDRSTAKYSLQISSTRIVSVNEARTSYASSVRSEGGTLDREPFSFFRLKRLQSAKVIKRPLNRCESTETRFGAENIFCPTDRLEQDFNANVKDTPKV